MLRVPILESRFSTAGVGPPMREWVLQAGAALLLVAQSAVAQVGGDVPSAEGSKRFAGAAPVEVQPGVASRARAQEQPAPQSADVRPPIVDGGVASPAGARKRPAATIAEVHPTIHVDAGVASSTGVGTPPAASTAAGDPPSHTDGGATSPALAPSPPATANAEPLPPVQADVATAERARELPIAESPRPSTRRVQVSAHLDQLFLLRNDSDFDRTMPAYDASGQSVGAFATLFRPLVTFHAGQNVRLHYEAEVGLNFWSKNNPDQQDPLAPDVFVLKHREIFGEAELGSYGIKAGFARLQDPTGLFVHHWIGAAQLSRKMHGGRVGLFAAQMPDPVYEGIVVGQNNFRRDTFLFGSNFTRAGLSASVHALVDSHLVGQTRWVVVPSVRLELEAFGFDARADLVLQAGQQNGVALGGGPATTLAAAVQLHGERRSKAMGLALNLLALSPDDAFDGNGFDGSFLYSAKSTSATVMLTEDEVRDWFDNLDERMGARAGPLVRHRAGLAVLDGKATWALSPTFALGGIVGAATVLQPVNALDGLLVGIELDAVAELKLGDGLLAQILAGTLVPGPAGAALANSIDLSKQQPIFMVESALKLSY